MIRVINYRKVASQDMGKRDEMKFLRYIEPRNLKALMSYSLNIFM